MITKNLIPMRPRKIMRINDISKVQLANHTFLAVLTNVIHRRLNDHGHNNAENLLEQSSRIGIIVSCHTKWLGSWLHWWCSSLDFNPGFT
jgi:hypothetical protein